MEVIFEKREFVIDKEFFIVGAIGHRYIPTDIIVWQKNIMRFSTALIHFDNHDFFRLATQEEKERYHKIQKEHGKKRREN